jgi:hypothetical protein
MKFLHFTAILMTLLLGACSPLTFSRSEGEQPQPAIEVIPASEEEPLVSVEEELPAPAKEELPAFISSEAKGYLLVEVADVTVELGPEFAIVAYAIVNFDLPDSCAQVEYIRTIQDGATFFIALGATPSDAEGCIQDTLPQRVTVPLNITDLPVGEYVVNVNGVRAEFSVTDSESTGDLRTAIMPNYMDDVAVESLSVVNGVGSPLPIHVVIEASLPKSCGQLGEVRMFREGSVFFVRLTAELPAQTDCNNDPLLLRFALPLNIAGLPEGTYEVNVNGAATDFELPMH